ncbi:MAG TPA: PEP-CTERM sorting domain-containing protein [Verrucomicrobiae bacterium]|nr:PEP-CTERM sorting domain-containing protein [Verrucomicrobiae bacterium]
MRLFITTVCALMGIVGSGLAQGTVDFRNGGITFRTEADRRVYLGAVGGTPLTGTTWVAGLWYVEGNNLALPTLYNDLMQVGREFHFRPDTAALKGYWVAPAGVSPIVVLPGVDIGETAVLQVRVWDSAKFQTFAGAQAGGQFGASCPFLYTVPPAGSPPDAYYMDNLRTIPGSPECIPEPSTWLLLAAGAIGLVVWRRTRNQY